MNSPTLLSVNRLFWLLPCLLWLAAVGAAVGRGNQPDSTASAALPSAVSTFNPGGNIPGFYTKYDPATTHWSWQYIGAMSTGCERLILRKDNPVGYDADTDVVTIDLMTYNTDDLCTKPPILASYTGGISTDAATTFRVNLDGALVFP